MAYYDFTAESQAIGARVRRGLRVAELRYQGEPWFVIQDPHGDTIHRYNAQEYAVLTWLDGQTSFEQLKQRFESEFSPFRVGYDELVNLVREFFTAGVLTATGAAGGRFLHEAAGEKQTAERWRRCKSLFAIQLKGWNPQRFIAVTYPAVGWFFSAAVVRLNVAMLVMAMVWLGYHGDEFRNRLPDLWSLLDGSNLWSMAMVLGSTKIAHELSHAYVHRRFGGACREIGSMIFFFVPTLYCNTNDASLMPNKWHRMAVAAAGMYVEMFLFSVATFTWWFTTPGMIQDAALNLMVVCGVSTLLTNGNPLMRYDGYFVLADYLEIPNLATRAGKEARRVFLRYGLGVDRERDDWTSRHEKRVLLGYAVASFVYKVFLISAISLVMLDRFKDYGLVPVGVVIAALSVSALFVSPIKSVVKFLKPPSARRHVRRGPAMLTGGLALAAGGLLTVVPWPYHVSGQCTVEVAGVQTVYCSHSGRLESLAVRPGELVQRGQVLATMVDPDLEREMTEVQAEIDEIERSIEYQQRTGIRIGRGDGLGVLIKRRQSAIDRRDVLAGRASELILRAPRDGRVYGLTVGRSAAGTYDDQVNRVDGNPLSPSNLGAMLDRGEPLCHVGDAGGGEVTMVLSQDDNRDVRPGQPVSLMLATAAGRLGGVVDSVAADRSRADELPRPIYQTSNAPAVVQAKRAASADKRRDITFRDGQTLAATMVQARVQLDAPGMTLNHGSIGTAKVWVGYRPGWWRLWRAMSRVSQRTL